MKNVCVYCNELIDNADLVGRSLHNLDVAKYRCLLTNLANLLHAVSKGEGFLCHSCLNEIRTEITTLLYDLTTKEKEKKM